MNRTQKDEPHSMPRLATQFFFFFESLGPFFSPYFMERERSRFKTKSIEIQRGGRGHGCGRSEGGKAHVRRTGKKEKRACKTPTSESTSKVLSSSSQCSEAPTTRKQTMSLPRSGSRMLKSQQPASDSS